MAIWRNSGSGWQLAAPAGFPDEAALHALVEEAPQILPLAGSPQLVVVGREVQLGPGSADLVAIEPDGRLVIIEVKLERNAEARRAIVSQILAYAAHLDGTDLDALETDVLGKHLHKRGFSTLAEAVASNDQEGAFDLELFRQGLLESLTDGRFRLVLVLDAAPDELVRLVGYLGRVGDNLLIDLVTVTAYEVDGSKLMVPQRVEPERSAPSEPKVVRKRAEGHLAEGLEDFEAAIDSAPESHRPALRKICAWGKNLAETNKLVKLQTYHGTGMKTLLPRFRDEGVGLITAYNDGKTAYLQFWRSVFERRAPKSLATVEALLGSPVRNQGITREITDELLSALAQAYAEGASASSPVVAAVPTHS